MIGLITAKTTLYTTGELADVLSNLTLGGPYFILGEDGIDVDVKFQQAIDAVRGCAGSVCTTKIDIVILRDTGSDGYNNYLYSMNGVNSVQTYVLTTLIDANKIGTALVVKNAELIFFAGGNQCDYVKIIKGSKVADSIKSSYARGAAIGVLV